MAGLCWENEKGQIEAVDTLVLATLETRNFSFEVLARTKEECERLFRDAWEIHCRDYPEADMDRMAIWLEDGEPNFHTITVGGVLRDGETLL